MTLRVSGLANSHYRLPADLQFIWTVFPLAKFTTTGTFDQCLPRRGGRHRDLVLSERTKQIRYDRRCGREKEALLVVVRNVLGLGDWKHTKLSLKSRVRTKHPKTGAAGESSSKLR